MSAYLNALREEGSRDEILEALERACAARDEWKDQAQAIADECVQNARSVFGDCPFYGGHYNMSPAELVTDVANFYEDIIAGRMERPPHLVAQTPESVTPATPSKDGGVPTVCDESPVTQTVENGDTV